MFIAIAWMELTPSFARGGLACILGGLKQTDTRAKSGSCSTEHPFVPSRQNPGYEEGRGGGRKGKLSLGYNKPQLFPPACLRACYREGLARNVSRLAGTCPASKHC